VLNTTRTIGLALGVSVMGALVAMGGPTKGMGVPPGFAAGLVSGLTVYGILAGATALLALVAFRGNGDGPADTPREVPSAARST
jgi:hypothetical protein